MYLGNYDEGDLALLELQRADDILVRRLIVEIRQLRDAVDERDQRITELEFDVRRHEEAS